MNRLLFKIKWKRTCYNLFRSNLKRKWFASLP